MVRVVYSDRVNNAFRNPLTIIGYLTNVNHFLDQGDSPVAVWKFDSYYEAVKFVEEHYHKWKYARGWVKEDWR